MTMIAHRIDTKLTEDQVLVLQNPPFRAGDNVEVILEKQNAGDWATEDGHFAAWKKASNKALQEVWNNDEDAAYDNFCEG